MQNYYVVRVFVIIGLVAVLPVFTSHATTNLSSTTFFTQETIWPTNGWEFATPESQGMDSVQLAAVFDYVESFNGDFDHVLVIRHGKIVLDAPIYPTPPNNLHRVFSVTKSVTSTLVGIAIDQGLIEGVDARLVDLLPNRTMQNMDEDKANIRLEDLLTMRAGLAWNEMYSDAVVMDNSLNGMGLSDDWVQYVLDAPQVHPPGTYFDYSTGVSQVLGEIVQEAADMPLLDFAEQNLFEPLNISPIWLLSPSGLPDTGGGLLLRPYDMAKFGYLFLHHGEWDGVQIVSSEWVQAATSVQVGSPGYGYQWWTGGGRYSATGIGGQRIIVDPELDMIVVTTARFEPTEIGPSAMLAQMIFDTVESNESLPENPDGVALLEARVAAVGTAPDPEAVSLPEIATVINGQRYVMDENELGWDAFVLGFEGDEARIMMESNGEILEIPIGMGGVYYLSDDLFSSNSPVSPIIAVRGEWLENRPNIFDVYLEDTGDIGQYRIRFEFEGDTVEIQLRISSSVTFSTITGRREP